MIPIKKDQSQKLCVIRINIDSAVLELGFVHFLHLPLNDQGRRAKVQPPWLGGASCSQG